MAETPVIVVIGSSNEAGFLALLDDVPIDDMTRWVGTGSLHPPIPSISSQRPYEVRIPGTRMLTPTRPHSTNVSRQISGVDGGRGTLDYSGLRVEAAVDSWIYVRKNASGQGKLRRVLSQEEPSNANWLFYRDALFGVGVGGEYRLVIDESASPLTRAANWLLYRDALLGGGAGRDLSLFESLTADEFGSWGEVRFLLDSYTIGAVDMARTTITRTTASTALALTSAVVGRDVVFFANDSVRRIVAFTENSITVDKMLDAGVVSGGFCILTGANACETLADLASPTRCSLHDLTFYLDPNAPVFLEGGKDFPNYDATPFQCPRVAYNGGPTINGIHELQFQVRSHLSSPLVVVEVGISASMISPFLQGAIPGQAPYAGFIGWFHDIKSLDFHPTSPDALFTATINQITAAKALILAEGKTAKVVGIFINLFDNDPADAQRVERLGENAQQLIDALWAHLGEQVPVSMSGPSRYGGTPAQRQVIYDQLLVLKAANKYIGVLDTRMDTEVSGGVFVYPDDYADDGLHFSATGQIKKARGYFDTWRDVVDRINAPAAPVDEPSLTASSAQEIVDIIDKTIIEGGGVAAYTVNGRTVQLHGLDQMLAARRYYVAETARKRGLRRTQARFSR